MEGIAVGTALLIALGAFLLLFLFWAVPVGLWVTAFASGVYVKLSNLVGMRFRKVAPRNIILPLISATKAGLKLNIDELEAHYLAGGDVHRVVLSLISADKANIELPLAGRDVLDAVQVSVNPKVIQTPKVSAMAKDGIQLIAIARVTVRANINRLVGGAGEETILARVGEGIVSTIGSAASHAAVLENPDAIKNIGAELQTDQAEADKRIAQAKAEERRAMAVATEQENSAKVQEMKAEVVRAQAEVPRAIAEAFKSGNLGIMDYMKYRNIASDTQMRKSIAGADESSDTET
jgi:uncharacterized protein YqfA (UPF0365 family)